MVLTAFGATIVKFLLKHNYSQRRHIISNPLRAVLVQAVFPNHLIDFPEGFDLTQTHAVPGLSFCSWIGLINWFKYVAVSC